MLLRDVVQQFPRRAVECFGEFFERRRFDSIQASATEHVVSSRHRQAGEGVELIRVGQAMTGHMPLDDGQVPSNHGIQGSLKLPLAQFFKVA